MYRSCKKQNRTPGTLEWQKWAAFWNGLKSIGFKKTQKCDMPVLSLAGCYDKRNWLAGTWQRRPFVISPWKGSVFVGRWLPDHASTPCWKLLNAETENFKRWKPEVQVGYKFYIYWNGSHTHARTHTLAETHTHTDLHALQNTKLAEVSGRVNILKHPHKNKMLHSDFYSSVFIDTLQIVTSMHDLGVHEIVEKSTWHAHPGGCQPPRESKKPPAV